MSLMIPAAAKILVKSLTAIIIDDLHRIAHLQVRHMRILRNVYVRDAGFRAFDVVGAAVLVREGDYRLG